jgi:hypothetical protein
MKNYFKSCSAAAAILVSQRCQRGDTRGRQQKLPTLRIGHHALLVGSVSLSRARSRISMTIRSEGQADIAGNVPR